MSSSSPFSASVASKILAISALISLLFVAGCATSGNLLTGGSTYKVGRDPINGTGYLGCMTLAISIGPPITVRFALSVTGGSATHGRILRWTDSSGDGSGFASQA